MRIFNCDGSEAEMCGNGLRCLAAFLYDLALIPSGQVHTIATHGFSYQVQCGEQRGNQMQVGMRVSAVESFPHPLSLSSSFGEVRGFLSQVGVRHFLILTANRAEWREYPLSTRGRELRSHCQLAPAGANISVLSLHAPSHIFLRTYERGVEEETQACGSASIAAALLALRYFSFVSPLAVIWKSGASCRLEASHSERLIPMWQWGEVTCLSSQEYFPLKVATGASL